MTLVFARLLREHARGESERVVHLIRLPGDGVIPSHLAAQCGARFEPYVLESLPRPGGAPCVPCLAAAPGGDSSADQFIISSNMPGS